MRIIFFSCLTVTLITLAAYAIHFCTMGSLGALDSAMTSRVASSQPNYPVASFDSAFRGF